MTSHGFADLVTEASDPQYAEIDQQSVLRIAELMNAADTVVPGAVGEVVPLIAEAIEAIVDRLKTGGRLFYVGAGTSGRLAVLDASECPPTFGTDPELVQGIIAGGPGALVKSVEGAEDDVDGGAASMREVNVQSQDAVVGISASGKAPFVIGAIDEAERRGALTVGLCCASGGTLSAHVRHPLEVVVGPELISGSTRLKAGTATKLVLNMISTVTMIKLGRTHGNRMIELSASNAKLADRALRIIVDVTGADATRARTALDAADGNVKVAVAMLELGLDADAARQYLANSQPRHG